MMASQKVFNLVDCSTPSFWRTPESSDIKALLDAGGCRNGGPKQTVNIKIVCDSIIPLLAW
jgi:hypothetical protein